MTDGLVEQIARAVLYEGYVLYPYRASSVKNQRRFNFGVLSPEAYGAASRGTEAWSTQTECLVETDGRASLAVCVRFLHLVSREVGEVVPARDPWRGEEPDYRAVASLEVAGERYQTWQEAVEREVALPARSIADLAVAPERVTVTFEGRRDMELLCDPQGRVAGVVVRTQRAVDVAVEVSAETVAERLARVSIHVRNPTAFDGAERRDREDALMSSLVSAHVVLGVGDGAFVSLLEPPEAYRDAAAACRNVGAWPILVGEEGARDLMLASPIILYDYPKIAPESAGDLFDATEIDEILTLRIMTLTEEEQREMRSVDERTRQILERTEALPQEQLMKLHGALRGLRRREQNET
jgi:hydrogenase maturation protease